MLQCQDAVHMKHIVVMTLLSQCAAIELVNVAMFTELVAACGANLMLFDYSTRNANRC